MTNILDPQLSSPRTLSPTEVTTLRSLLMSQLIISSNEDDDDDTKDDAENLLDYALDMIGEGENVGHVTDEVSLYLLLVKKRGRGADLFFRGIWLWKCAYDVLSPFANQLLYQTKNSLISYVYFDTPPYTFPLVTQTQLKFMEMPVCNDDAAHKLGICLTKFFRELDGGNNNDDEPVDVKEKVVEETKETKPVVEAKPVKAVVTTEKVKPKAPSPRSVAPSPPSRVVSPPSSSYTTSRSSSSSNNNSSSSWMAAKQSSAANNVYDARSSSQRRQDEMKNMFGSSNAGGGGSSIKERMKAFNNESKVNFDPVHFAVRKNKEAKGKLC